MKKRISRLEITLVFMGISLLLPGILSAQTTGLSACKVVATGTGKTTGEIIQLKIYNPTGSGITDKVGPFFIPSGGDYQPYIVPSIKTVTIPPGGTAEILLTGYCTNIRKAPAEPSDTLPAMTGWTAISGPAVSPQTAAELKMNPDNPSAAPFLLAAVTGIRNAYDQLRSEGKIFTPRSGNPEKEREEVIQQTFWIYTAQLRQEPYTKNDFKERTYAQFEKTMSSSPQALPADKKQQLDKGIEDFWNTFEAVGVEAKILGKPATVADSKACGCGEAHLIAGQKIQVYLPQKPVDPVKGDSVSWTNNQVLIGRPEILCTCQPLDCLPEKAFEMRTVITYKDKRYPAVTSPWTVYEFQRKSPVMERPGEMLIELRYKCSCAGQPCTEQTVNRKIVFYETNKCCDRVREKNNGVLKFALKNGSLMISGKTLTVQSPGCELPPITFDFDLETYFCNLTEDQVFSQLLQLLESGSSGGVATDFRSVRQVQMTGPSNDMSSGRYYGFGFSKTVNKKEFTLYMSLDEQRCIYDFSIICDGKVQEFTAPPYFSPADLSTMANNLANPSEPSTWVQVMLIHSHLARAAQYNQTTAYQAALHTYLARLQQLISTMQAGKPDAALKARLDELKKAVTDCLQKNDFKLLGPILQKMLPVSNSLNQ